jgi:hypothetical protein
LLSWAEALEQENSSNKVIKTVLFMHFLPGSANRNIALTVDP